MAASILFATEAATWAESLQTTLAQAGYQLSVITNLADAPQAVRQHQPDVIIAAANDSSLMFFQSVSEHHTPPRPLLVLISDQTPQLPTDGLSADIVLPPQPHYITQQLALFLRLMQANQQLDQQQHILQEELERQKRAASEIEILKNAIVRNISHELKTPLLQVKSAVSLIGEDSGLTDRRLFTYAENATARLEALVRNITMLGSSLDIELAPIILRDSVEYARRNLGRVWQRKSEADRIKLDIEENLAPVHADKQGLSTVLQLLMDNALKFSEKPIEVIARREGDYVYVGVKDYGIGIPPEKIQSIFEMFYQVDGSSTRRYGGAGVGLALVKLILDHHGVAIYVDSVPNKGSTFYFFLRIVDISHS
jgi:signal transduction histidine kinase